MLNITEFGQNIMLHKEFAGILLTPVCRINKVLYDTTYNLITVLLSTSPFIACNMNYSTVLYSPVSEAYHDIVLVAAGAGVGLLVSSIPECLSQLHHYLKYPVCFY